MALASIVVPWRNYGTDHVHYVRQKPCSPSSSSSGLTNLLYNFNLSRSGAEPFNGHLTVSGVLSLHHPLPQLAVGPAARHREQIVENLTKRS